MTDITLVTIWYDESPDWLYELVCSVAPICSRVVAVDGAYALYPDAQGRSHPDQASAIVFGAAQHALDLTLHQPAQPWSGNEVKKRNFALDLASAAKPDWLLILDGDEFLAEFPPDLHERLEATDESAATICHRFPDRTDGICTKLYRPPVRIGKWHAEYLDPSGVNLRDDPRLHFADVVVHHRKGERDPERQENAARYYTARDDAGIEPRA